MRCSTVFLWCLWIVAAVACSVSRADDGLTVTKPIELLGDQGLDDWIWCTPSGDTKKRDIWSYENGVLRCKGQPAGYLQTRRWYKDYVLELEWRWPAGKGGNNGVLVHASAPFVLGVWPRSLEIQLGSPDAGDFWVIGSGVDIQVKNRNTRRTGRRTVNLTDGSEKPIGEWNHMKVICRGNDVEVYVNKDKVNHGTDCTINEGAISLQSEGTPIEYRNLRLVPLPK